jgi:hypothetical protein
LGNTSGSIQAPIPHYCPRLLPETGSHPLLAVLTLAWVPAGAGIHLAVSPCLEMLTETACARTASQPQEAGAPCARLGLAPRSRGSLPARPCLRGASCRQIHDHIPCQNFICAVMSMGKPDGRDFYWFCSSSLPLYPLATSGARPPRVEDSAGTLHA